jgi:MFS family permease
MGSNYLNFDRLIIMSIGYLILYSGANIANQDISYVSDEAGFGNLGYYSSALYWLTFGCFSFLATPIVHRLGDKNSLIMGCATYTFYVGAMILPVYAGDNLGSETWDNLHGFISAILLLSAAVNGFGASMMFVAGAKYVAECATYKNIGLYNSIIWMFTNLSLIIGNIVAGFCLNSVKISTLYIMLTIMVFASTIWYCFLPKPRPHPDIVNLSMLNKGRTTTTEFNSRISAVAAASKELHKSTINEEEDDDVKQSKTSKSGQNDDVDMVIEEHDPLDALDEDNLTFCQEIKLTWKLFTSKRMLFLVPLMMWTAISCAIYTSTFYPFLSNGFGDDVDAETQL